MIEPEGAVTTVILSTIANVITGINGLPVAGAITVVR
jgi:hypothetical protein